MGLEPQYVVGIGASAGGLESLERFFDAIAADTPLTFVVVQHLSATHKSLMPELITRFAHLPVLEAQDGMRLERGTIYVLKPGTEIEVRREQLAVMEREGERVLSFPIDRMLTSLASAYGPNAIAVILSGSGSDGSRGIRKIDAAGGVVLVEDPTSAAFDGMPRAAVETGVPSAAAGAAALAQLVLEHASAGETPGAGELAAVENIIALLKNEAGDFGEYRRGTLYRRIMRRVRLTGAVEIERYSRALEGDPKELSQLHQDLLIGVTSFFRDRSVFASLEEAIAGLVATKVEPQRELRAWCAGCATGQEAYSLAMLFDEAISRSDNKRDFKIFATDIHPAALDAAAAGVFSEESIANIEPARQAKYFARRADGRVQVDASLRNRIVFARHDVLRDTPFTNLDLVSCRNLLIYLKVSAQRVVLSSLSYGLRLGGLLLLGSSETPGELTSHFDTVSESARLFRKKLHSRRMMAARASTRLGMLGPFTDLPRHEARLLPIYDAVLEAFMPPAFLISEQRTLIDSYGDAARLLRINKRRPSGDFLELVPNHARAIVAGLLARAQREKKSPPPASLGWPLPDAPPLQYQARVHYLGVPNSEPAYVLSLLEQSAGPTADTEATPAMPPTSPELEAELAHARITLQATMEELEASNEELQATNEELVASNEELQSVNEELHSVNEELHTINAEHQLKIGELTELNRDISHLLESIDVATVYLDQQLRIRKYTPRAGQLFRLVEHDIGRYLESFNHQLHYPLFMDDVRQVRDRGESVEKEVRGHDEHWYFVRLLPYRVGAEIQGVVVTFTDATTLAAAKERARQLSAIVDSSADAIIGMSLEGIVTSWNDAACRVYGYTASEMVGESIMKLATVQERDALKAILGSIAAGERLVNIAVTRVAKSGTVLEIAKTMSPVVDAQGFVVGIATIDRDIRVQKELERRLRESEARYEDLYNNAPDLYLTVDLRTDRVLEGNETLFRVTGYRRDHVRAWTLVELFPESSRDAVRRALEGLRSGRSADDLPLELSTAQGATMHVTLSATIMHAPDGSAVGARVVMRNVSTRRNAELELEQAAAIREQFLAMVSHELRSPLHAANAALQLLDGSKTSPELRSRSETIVRRQMRQMTRMVDDLLDVSRILHGKLHVERRPVDLADVVRAAVDAQAPAYDARGVRLVMEGFDVGFPVFGDEGRLTQVFDNLLGNALRHTPAGKTVEVTGVQEGNVCEVRVIDEGRGIAEEELRSIFDMFGQARQELARARGGLGLGLTIAQRIIGAHGGSIQAQSDGLDLGATFTVQLSLDPRAATAPRRVPGSERPLTIVIVEDQDDAREMMTMLLEAEGHSVHAAPDGEAGLQVIEDVRPEVALLDIGLPKMDGYALAQAVRSALGNEVRLVALSGYGQPDDVKRAREAGFDRHLTKPVDRQRLRFALRERDD